MAKNFLLEEVRKRKTNKKKYKKDKKEWIYILKQNDEDFKT